MKIIPEPEPKPIDKLVGQVKDLSEAVNDIKKICSDIKTIKNDVAVIKSRLHELNRIRIQQEQEQAENISNGWGVGWW